jgi:hypothetical protein
MVTQCHQCHTVSFSMGLKRADLTTCLPLVTCKASSPAFTQEIREVKLKGFG